MKEFKRYDQPDLRLYQRFIDRDLPVCPFCLSNAPSWALAHDKKEDGASEILYRCGNCGATLSTGVLPENLLGGKERGAGIRIKICDSGSKWTEDRFDSKEYPLRFMQQLAGVEVSGNSDEDFEANERRGFRKRSKAFAITGFVLGFAAMISFYVLYSLNILLPFSSDLSVMYSFFYSAPLLISLAGLLFSLVAFPYKPMRKVAIVSITNCIIVFIFIILALFYIYYSCSVSQRSLVTCMI